MELPKNKSFPQDITLLYDWSKRNNIFSRLIVVHDRSFESLYMMIQRLLNEGINPSQLYDDINQYNEFITQEDIVMAYYHSNPQFNVFDINDFYRQIDADLFNNQISLDNKYTSWSNALQESQDIAAVKISIIDSTRNLIRDDISSEEIYNIINTYKNLITPEDFIMLYYVRLLQENVDPLIYVNRFATKIHQMPFPNIQTLENKYNQWSQEIQNESDSLPERNELIAIVQDLISD